MSRYLVHILVAFISQLAHAVSEPQGNARPVSVDAVAQNSSIKITWALASIPSGRPARTLLIYRAEVTPGPTARSAPNFTLITSRNGVPAQPSEYIDSNVSSGKYYDYRVSVSGGGKQNSDYKWASSLGVRLPPSAPTVTLSTKADGSRELSWNSLSDASGYSIERALNASSAPSPFASVMAPTVSQALTPEPGRGMVYFQVKAFGFSYPRIGQPVAIFSPPSAPKIGYLNPPGNIRVSDLSQTGLKLNWDGEPNLNYRILQIAPGNVQTILTPTPISNNSFEVRSLSPQTHYRFSLVAYGTAVTSSPTELEVDTPPPPPQPPQTPRVVNTTPDSVELSWAAPAGATYILIRRSEGTGAPMDLARLSGSASTFSDNTNLYPGHTYRYELVAGNTGGSSAAVPTVPANVQVPLPKPPVRPSGLYGELISANTVKLEWADNSPNETEFVIYRKGPNENEMRELRTLSGVNDPLHQLRVFPDAPENILNPGLVEATDSVSTDAEYRYKVVARLRHSSGLIADSESSETITVKTSKFYLSGKTLCAAYMEHSNTSDVQLLVPTSTLVSDLPSYRLSPSTTDYLMFNAMANALSAPSSTTPSSISGNGDPNSALAEINRIVLIPPGTYQINAVSISAVSSPAIPVLDKQFDQLFGNSPVKRGNDIKISGGKHFRIIGCEDINHQRPLIKVFGALERDSSNLHSVDHLHWDRDPNAIGNYTVKIQTPDLSWLSIASVSGTSYDYVAIGRAAVGVYKVTYSVPSAGSASGSRTHTIFPEVTQTMTTKLDVDAIVPFKFTDSSDFSIESLEFDGQAHLAKRSNLRLESGSAAIRTHNSSQYLIKDIYAHHFLNDGVYVGNGSTGLYPGLFKADRHVRIHRLISKYNSRIALMTAQVRDLTVSMSRLESSGYNALSGDTVNSYYNSLPPAAAVDIEPNTVPESVTFGVGSAAVTELAEVVPNAAISGKNLVRLRKSAGRIEDMTPVDVMTGNIVFENCLFLNNRGRTLLGSLKDESEVPLTENIKVRHSIFRHSDITVDSTEEDTVFGLITRNGLVEGNDMEFGNGSILLTNNTGSANFISNQNEHASLIFKNNKVKSSGRINASWSRHPLVVTDNIFVSTHAAPLPGSLFIQFNGNPRAYFMNNAISLSRSLVPGNAPRNAEITVINLSVRRASGNRYYTDYAPTDPASPFLHVRYGRVNATVANGRTLAQIEGESGAPFLTTAGNHACTWDEVQITPSTLSPARSEFRLPATWLCRGSADPESEIVYNPKLAPSLGQDD